MNERIKELRSSLGLTMEKFGEKLGVKKSAINKIEKGENNITEQMFKSICREYSVNEEWLRTGEGSMFHEISPDDEYMKAAAEIQLSNDEAAMQAVISYWKMEPEFKKIFWDKLLEVAEVYKKSQEQNVKKKNL